MKMSWKIVGLVLGALLLNVPQAFADVKAVVVIECNPHSGTVEQARASSSSPVSREQLLGQQCTDVMVALDGLHFKVKETLRGVSATTINEFPGSTMGTTASWNSNYLYVFFLD